MPLTAHSSSRVAFFTAVTPFYQYCDYSGCGAADPTLGYSENPQKGLERRRTDYENSKLPSHGTDWFVRLRDGDSNYAGINLKVQLVEGVKTNAETIACTLCGNHLWRGFLRTSTAYAGKTLQYRFEGERTTNPGATKQVLRADCWKSARNLERAEDIPNSPALQNATSNDWATVFCDATTGYLLFQLDDHTLPPALTVGGVKVGPGDFLRAAMAVLATGADKVTVTPSDPLAEVRNQVELRDFHAVGTWVFTPDYKDAYTTDRLRWQVWTMRREPMDFRGRTSENSRDRPL